MKWDEVIALVPFAILVMAALVGAVVLLSRFVAEAPIENGVILFFSIWMTLGFGYLLLKG